MIREVPFMRSKIEGWITEKEYEYLKKASYGKDCLEIGSYRGLSSSAIAHSANSLICIDTFQCNKRNGQEQTGELKSLKPFLKNTRKFSNIITIIAKSENVAQFISDLSLDFIFVDGGHDYESVKSDILNYWPKLKNGGIMAVHDYGNLKWPEVRKATDDSNIKITLHIDTIAVAKKVNDT